MKFENVEVDKFLIFHLNFIFFGKIYTHQLVQGDHLELDTMIRTCVTCRHSVVGQG